MAYLPDEYIYAGLSGIELGVDRIELGNGIVLRETYAHLMAPFLMAFSPAQPGKAHPAPWKAAQGGLGFDITAELVIPKECGASIADRIGIARTVVALMRIWTSPDITLPVISNMSFSAAAQAGDDQAYFMPLEIEPRYFPLECAPGLVFDSELLQWVREHWESTTKLQRNHAEFSLAIDTLDSGQFIRNPALTLVSLWAALEALFSPSTAELRFRVTALIASYLERPGDERRKLHKHLMRLYDERCAAAHGRPRDNPDSLLQSFELLRRVVIRIVDENHVPTTEELDEYLFGM